MTTELERWARAEREFLKEEIKWLGAGTKLKSPSGDDISAQKLAELKIRLEHVTKALSEQENAQGS